MIFVNSLNFQQRIEQTLQIQFGVTIDHASKRQVYEAMMRSVREILSQKKFGYEQELKKRRVKRSILHVHGIFSGKNVKK